jgi:FdhD protein
MRTPGHEMDLAMGFLLTEGVVRSPAEVGAIAFCPEGGLGGVNEVRVTLSESRGPQRPASAHRRVFSSCSICGADMIRWVAEDIAPFDRPAGRLRPQDIFAVAAAMRQGQALFQRTGGTHAAALTAAPVSPEQVLVREDIGRHNALDKAVGALARMGRSPAGMLLMLSGRLSFEMAAKAARAGIGDVAAVSAPTELAVALGRRLRMFLTGFVRQETMTIYSGEEALAV